MEKRVNIQEFVPTDLLKIPTILQQLIWMIMSITTDNEQASVDANSAFSSHKSDYR